MFDDLAGWMMVGLIAAGAMNVFLPEDFFSGHLGSGPGVMLLMLVVGLPMYFCASASTPIAAAMIMKGLSPGSALVFLLAGPAANITSMALVRRFMGNRSFFIYLSSISACAIMFGLILDWIYFYWGISAVASIGAGGELVPEYLRAASGGVFMLLISRYMAAWLSPSVRKRQS
jgi:hypothetical protein